MSDLGERSTLAEGKAWLRERLDDGAACPVCTQFAKVYRRKINSGMARALILLHRQGGGFHHLSSLARFTHEGGQLLWWGLIEEEPPGVRDDGGRSSWYRITARGTAFVQNRLLVAKYALIYDGRLLGMDDSEQASIVDALGTRFNYQELMAGV